MEKLDKGSNKEELNQFSQKLTGQRRTAVFRQILMVFIANLTTVFTAMSRGHPAVSLPELQSVSNKFHLNDSEASWFASIHIVGSMVGGLFTGYFLDRLGRKRTLLFINFLSAVAWALMGTANYSNRDIQFAQMILSRIIIGVTTGIAVSTVSVYSAEISYPSFRGRLTIGSSLSPAIGIFLMFILGYVFKRNWRLQANIGCGLCVFMFGLTFFIRNSPLWLLSKNRVDDSRKSLLYFRGFRKGDSSTSSEFEEEFSMLKTAVAPADEKNLPFLEAIQAPEFYKPLFIMCVSFTITQLSGAFLVTVVYTVKICIEARVSIDPYLCAIIVAFIRISCTLGAGFALDSFGRRPPAMLSGFLMGICMFCLAACSKFPEIVTLFPHLSSISICVYIFGASIGWLTIPFSMIGEVFPQEMRGKGVGISTFWNFFLAFFCVKFFPSTATRMGASNIFIIYSTVSFISVIFVYIFLPETKNKTLIEISEEFKKPGFYGVHLMKK